MKYFIYGFMFVVTSVASFESKAVTGNEYLEYDGSQKVNYMEGVIDGGAVAICQPDGVTFGQAIDIVDAFLAKFPERRHYRASSIITNVLSALWPCQVHKSSLKY